MDDEALRALEQVASGHVEFHTGAWGGPPGYRWQGVGSVVSSTWEGILARLEAKHLIAVEKRLGPLERPVTLTPDGLAMLTSAR